MQKYLGLVVILIALPGSLVACDRLTKKSGAGAATSASPASSAPAVTAAAAPTVTASAKPVEDKITEYDLAKAGAKWKGYSAKLPREGAQVMADGVDGARLATNGREENPVDIVWTPGKPHFADLKKGLAAGEKLSKAKSTFLADAADRLEYTTAYEGGSKTYHFDIVMKVGKADFHCSTGPMGASDEAQFKKHKDACQTLAKK